MSMAIEPAAAFTSSSSRLYEELSTESYVAMAEALLVCHVAKGMVVATRVNIPLRPPVSFQGLPSQLDLARHH